MSANKYFMHFNRLKEAPAGIEYRTLCCGFSIYMYIYTVKSPEISG